MTDEFEEDEYGRKVPKVTDEEQSDYSIGYGKPPKSTRFRKGASGNPKGRPKGAKNKSTSRLRDLAEMVLEEAGREVEINDKGRTVKMKQVEAVLRSTFLQGIKGKPSSQRLALQLYDEGRNSVVDSFSEWIGILINLRIKARSDLKKARSSGNHPPAVRDYPDDVFIDPSVPVAALTGPLIDQDIPFWESAWAELCELKAELDTYSVSEVDIDVLMDEARWEAIKAISGRINQIVLEMVKKTTVFPTSEETYFRLYEHLHDRAWTAETPRKYALPEYR